MPKNVTVYLPDEVATEMEKFPEVNWSEVSRDAIVNYIAQRGKAFDSNQIIIQLEGIRPATEFLDSPGTISFAFKITNRSEYDVTFDRASYSLKINVGPWAPSVGIGYCLEPRRLRKGEDTIVYSYYGGSPSLIEDISEKARDEILDVVWGIDFKGFFLGPLGLFERMLRLTQTVPNSWWKRDFGRSIPRASRI